MNDARLMTGVRVVMDGVMAAVSVALAYWLRYNVNPGHIPLTGGEVPEQLRYEQGGMVVGAIVVVVFALTGAYRYRRGVQFIDEFFAMIGSLVVAAVVVLAAIGLFREPHFEFSRLVFVYWIVLAAVVISLARYALRRIQAGRRARGIGSDRALVVGWGAAADLLIQRIRMFPDYGYRLVGVLTDRAEPDTEVAGVKVLGKVDTLPALVAGGDVDIVFIALADYTQERLLDLMERCGEDRVDFRIVPSMLEIMTSQVTSDQLDGIPLLQFRRGLDIDGPAQAVKRVFDFVLAGLGLVVLSPLLLLIAILVKATSPGPVLVRQERVGLHGARFTMLKFRSMRIDAEVRTGPVWASPDDPRRTAVGRLIRRLSLDELPQLWNIVAGDMSLVGPRAERPNFVQEFTERLPRYADRLRVRPGLAGWAQANDLRGQTPVEERLIYDLYYIENWSLVFDLKILLITLFRVWTHRNAY